MSIFFQTSSTHFVSFMLFVIVFTVVRAWIK